MPRGFYFQFGDAIKPLVIELYIRALTTDMNELENQKSKANKEKVQETAQRLSQEFLRLADYVSSSVSTARECVLTAFSLHPTRACYDRIREIAIACGKVSREESDLKDVQIKVGYIVLKDDSGFYLAYFYSMFLYNCRRSQRSRRKKNLMRLSRRQS